MVPADAHTDAATGPAPQADTGAEDTLDLELSEELLALFGEDTPATAAPHLPPGAPVSPASSVPGDAGPAAGTRPTMSRAAASDLLDRPADWRPVTTPAGIFQLVPVRPERDLAVLSRWMNDPRSRPSGSSPDPKPSRPPICALNSTATGAASPASECWQAFP